MKKRTSGFVSARMLDREFISDLIRELRWSAAKQIFDDPSLGYVAKSYATDALRDLHNFTGEVNGFTVAYFKGSLQVKKHPNLVYTDDPEQGDLFMGLRCLNRTVIKHYGIDGYDEIITVKLGNTTVDEIKQDVKEYNAARSVITWDYDCTGAECGSTRILPQRKQGELSFYNRVQYDY